MKLTFLLLLIFYSFFINCTYEVDNCLIPGDKCNNDTEKRKQPDCYYQCLECNGEYYEQMDCEEFE